jgi:hypothetical protein
MKPGDEFSPSLGTFSGSPPFHLKTLALVDFTLNVDASSARRTSKVVCIDDVMFLFAIRTAQVASGHNPLTFVQGRSSVDLLQNRGTG